MLDTECICHYVEMLETYSEILYLIEHFVLEQPVRVFLVSENSKLGFNFSYLFIQGLTHRLVRGPLGATWFEIFGVHLVLVRCDP